MTTPACALTLDLKPSRQLLHWIVGSHAVAAASALLLGLAVPWVVAVLAAFAAHGVYTWWDMGWQRSLRGLRVLDQEYRLIDLHGNATFSSGRGYFVTPWLTILELQVNGRRKLLPLLPDSASADSLRQLRVVLRCQPV